MIRFYRLLHMLMATSAATGFLALPASHALAADGMRAPATEQAPADLKQALLRGDFAAKIMPRAGYTGSLFIGKMPDAKLKSGRVLPPGKRDFYPADLGYYGGPLVSSASYINFYWGESDSSTWGYPDSYEYYLNNGTMSEVLDPYVGNATKTKGWWPNASIYWYGGSPGSLIYTSQIATEVQALATYDRANRGAGLNYTNIYHVFLPPGTDTCFDNPASGCYNPDGKAPGPFNFCGYHTYTQLSDGTVVLFTVEPYESVGGCSTGAGTSNDTANVLGHEIAETITDPIPGAGWVGEWTATRGQEIGDECAWTLFNHNLDGVTYYTQDWYSDKYHACADTP